jgi:short-subunit dehydrogenase
MADTQEPQANEAEEVRPVAVIIGASSGIGMATALEFAQQQYDVVLAARRKKELDEVAQQCRELGVEALVVPTDITSDKAVHMLAEAAIRQFHHIDVWVNDAGVYLTSKFEDTPLEDTHRLFETNFFGYVHGSQAALTEFRRAGHGTLINISSVNAAAPMPYTSMYGASKAAVRALDESLRMELHIDGLQDDIHVCTVMPSTTDTNIFQNAANYMGKEAEAIAPIYEPEYVAKQIVALARKPKREIIVGPAGKLMAIQRAHMPGSYEKRMSSYVKQQLQGEQPATLSDGNLFDPVADHQGMHGGWRERKMRADKLNAGLGIGLGLAAAVAAGVGIALAKRQKPEPTIAERSHGLLHAIFS